MDFPVRRRRVVRQEQFHGRRRSSRVADEVVTQSLRGCNAGNVPERPSTSSPVRGSAGRRGESARKNPLSLLLPAPFFPAPASLSEGRYSRPFKRKVAGLVGHSRRGTLSPHRTVQSTALTRRVSSIRAVHRPRRAAATRWTRTIDYADPGQARPIQLAVRESSSAIRRARAPT